MSCNNKFSVQKIDRDGKKFFLSLVGDKLSKRSSVTPRSPAELLLKFIEEIHF